MPLYVVKNTSFFKILSKTKSEIYLGKVPSIFFPKSGHDTQTCMQKFKGQNSKAAKLEPNNLME